MSFLKELQLQHEVSNIPQLSLEEINISLEGLSLSKIKELIIKGIKKVKDFFIRIFKWIREKVLSFLKSKRTKEIIEKAKVIRDIKKLVSNKSISKEDNTSKSSTDSIYTDEDIISILIQLSYDKKFPYICSLINFDTGELVNPDDIINMIQEYSKDFFTIANKAINGDDIDDDFDTLSKIYPHNTVDKSFDASFDILFKCSGKNGIEDLNRLKELNLNSLFSKITKEKILKYADEDLFKLINKCDDFYKKHEAEIEKYIREVEKISSKGFNKESNNDAYDFNNSDFDGYKERQRNENIRMILNYLMSHMKSLSALSKFYASYIQLLDYICNKFSSKEYLIDPNPPKYKHLYHLSDDPELVYPERKDTILLPLLPKTGGSQFLPPRTSFCEEMIRCCYGTPKYFLDNKKLNEDAIQMNRINNTKGLIKSDALYLYEGIPDDDTKFIKQSIVNSIVGEAIYSKEICVISNIRVKKVAKVIVHYDPTVPQWSPRKFAEMEIIEEY